jgi:tungstate transport system substrate-binding protein
MLTRRALLVGSASLAAMPFARASGPSYCVSLPTTLVDTGFSSYLADHYAMATGQHLSFVEATGGQAPSLPAYRCTPVLIANHAGVAASLARAHLVGSAHTLMQNDFVIAGPKSDPAAVLWVKDAPTALRAIARAKCSFISRGDQSGTHSVEVRLWEKAGIYPVSRPGYIQSGLSMRSALQLAHSESAYILVDRATWLARALPSNLMILVEGGPDLINTYSLILMDSKTQPGADMDEAMRLTDWLLSATAKSLIANFRIAGQAAFRAT